MMPELSTLSRKSVCPKKMLSLGKTVKENEWESRVTQINPVNSY